LQINNNTKTKQNQYTFKCENCRQSVNFLHALAYESKNSEFLIDAYYRWYAIRSAPENLVGRLKVLVIECFGSKT